jgi:hypothetical protein
MGTEAGQGGRSFRYKSRTCSNPDLAALGVETGRKCLIKSNWFPRGVKNRLKICGDLCEFR